MRLVQVILGACVLTLIAFVPALAGPHPHQPKYEFFDLGDDTFPLGINSLGDVVGGAGGEAFLRKHTGEVVRFGIPGAFETSATSINDTGVITGDAELPGSVVGFYRTPDGVMTTFAPSDSTFPVSINSSGTIAGYYDAWDGHTHGFARKPDGTIVTIDPPGSFSTLILDMNDQGTVVGRYYSSDGFHGFIQTADGAVTNVDGPGATQRSTQTFVTTINNNGQVAGIYIGDGPGTHGYFRDIDGTMTTFSTDAWSRSINATGEVVGSTTSRGFIFYQGSFKAFHGPVQGGYKPRTEASGVNDNGDIIGNYRDKQGKHRIGFVRHP